ncbi:hypothetical protein L9F63_018109, partial [Diploptera punctata]
PFYMQEYTNDTLELVKSVLPGVHNLSPSEVEAIASVILKTYRNESTVAKNQSILKPVSGMNDEILRKSQGG